MKVSEKRIRLPMAPNNPATCWVRASERGPWRATGPPPRSRLGIEAHLWEQRTVSSGTTHVMTGLREQRPRVAVRQACDATQAERHRAAVLVDPDVRGDEVGLLGSTG